MITLRIGVALALACAAPGLAGAANVKPVAHRRPVPATGTAPPERPRPKGVHVQPAHPRSANAVVRRGPARMAGVAAPAARPTATAQALRALPPAGPSQAEVIVAASGWNPGWRSDPRFDWRGWRAQHAALFRLGAYHPPLGPWAYAALPIGATLAAAYITDETVIADPQLYHLPQVGEPLRWVRYYDDALLVNIDTGQVFDVVPALFR